MTFSTDADGGLEMWTNNIRQVVEIFQQVFQVTKVIKDPVKYVEEYKGELRAAGPELEFLQLAKPDKKSPFDWSPTPLLMEIIADRKMAKKAKPLYEADILYQLLDDYVFGYKSNRAEGSALTRELLLATGLLREGSIGDLVSSELHNLFCNAYFAKRRKDRLPIFPELESGVYEVRVKSS